MQEKKHDAVSPSDAEAPSYWYNSMDGRHIGVLNLLRDYREAERSMRARTRDAMRMNETELLALRFLLMRTQQQHEVLQRDIARELGITGASASALCQRLERDGYINRFPHPHDKRATVLVPTEKTDSEVRGTLTGMHRLMLEGIQSLTDDELKTVEKFLHSMIRSVTQEH